MEEVNIIVDEAKSMMDRAVEHVGHELAKIRAGKAMPSMLDGVQVEYYGAMTPLNQVSSVNSLDARTLIIKPWEKSMIGEIEKAIRNADLGLNPQNDGESVIINIPTLTEERRLELVKHAKHEGEQGKISLRNARHDAIHHLKSLKDEGVAEDDIKRGEDMIQEVIDKHSDKIDKLVSQKEEDIMHV
jgi:ribosome recycling factor